MTLPLGANSYAVAMVQHDAYIPLFIGDFLRDTAHLTAEESGAYIQFLARLWISDGRLSDDDKMLARIARLTRGRWAKVRPILAPLFIIADGVWQHQRASQWLAYSKAACARRSLNASIAAKARWHRHNASYSPIPPALAPPSRFSTSTPPPPPLREERVNRDYALKRLGELSAFLSDSLANKKPIS